MAVMPGNCQYSLFNQSQQIRRDRKKSSSSSSSYPNSNPNSISKTTSHCHSTSTISAVIDIVVVIVVLTVCAYLALPYLQFLYRGLQFTFWTLVREFPETSVGLKWCLCVSFLLLCVLCFLIVRYLIIDDRKCDNVGCKGLKNGREFDIKIETEDCLRNSAGKGGGGEGTVDELDDEFFELDVEHHRKLEDRLKKLAPPNGRAILIFRASCGCSVGRMVVWGPKKRRRNGKK